MGGMLLTLKGQFKSLTEHTEPQDFFDQANKRINLCDLSVLKGHGCQTYTFDRSQN